LSQKKFNSLAEAAESMIHIKDEFEPNQAEHRIYDELYQQIFKKLFGQLAPLYKKINAIIPDVV
jgi:sugar (pentulose or hexulose) kinase